MKLITLGTTPDGKPFQVPRRIFEEGHVDIRGMTRSGKTTVEIQRLESLMATGRDFFLILDLGADIYFRNAMKEAAETHGRNFKEFSLFHERMAFDPFQSFRDQFNPAILSAWSSAAFGLDHGSGYGTGYYSSVNSQVIEEACAAILVKGNEVYMQSLIDEISRSAKKKDTEAYNVLLPLKHFSQLNGESSLEQINIAQSLKDGDVVYMALDCLVAPQVARVVAGLACATAIMECIDRSHHQKMDNHCFVTVDEFSQLASPAWGTWLTASGKHNCNFSLMYQSTAQLSKGGMLDQIIFENCRTHLYYTCVGSKDVEQLREMSQEIRTKLGGSSGFGMSASVSSREVVDRQLSVNTILEVSGTEREFFAIVNDGKGHNEPVRVRAQEMPSDVLARRKTPPDWMSRKPERPVITKNAGNHSAPVCQEILSRMNAFFAKQSELEEYNEQAPGEASLRSEAANLNLQKSLFDKMLDSLPVN